MQSRCIGCQVGHCRVNLAVVDRTHYADLLFAACFVAVKTLWCDDHIDLRFITHAQTAATVVGELLARRAQEAAVDNVHWERKRGQRFHGKIAALLTAMQSGGLKLV